MFNNIQKAIILGAGILAGGFFQSASADFSINQGKLSVEHKQDIVITLKSDPFIAANEEEACLAVTFARMLSMNPVNNVTLFVTLDGVELADNGNGLDGITCVTPNSPPWQPDGGLISLERNLEAFLAGGTDDDMVVCPICWNTRKKPDSTTPAPLPDYGVLPGGNAPGDAIGTLIGNADKILDF